MEFKYNIEPDFLSHSECDDLTNYYSDKLVPSEIINSSHTNNDVYFRNSDDHFIDAEKIENNQVLDIVDKLKSRFSQISNLPIMNQEMLTIIKYQPGQYFKTHFDSFTEKSHLDVQELIGGQRVWTFIVCLKEASVGGFTYFDNLKESIKLKKGECIFWKNTDMNGQVFSESLHSGLSPEVGEKWILNCWVREKRHIAINHEFLSDLMTKFTKEQMIKVLNDI